MTFRKAMDAIGLTAAEVAKVYRFSTQTVRQMRLDPGTENYRRPPEGWERVLAGMARQRSAELAKIADRLERAG